MTSEPSYPANAGLWSRFLALKTFLVALSMVGMLATNIASVVSASAHDWMHKALVSVLSIAGQPFADRAMANSPKRKLDQVVQARTADLDTKNRQLAEANAQKVKELEVAQVRNQKLVQKMDANGKQAKATVAVVHQRLAKSISRGVAALPGEAIPYLGVGVALTVTALDIYDACQTMKDFNVLLRMLDQGEEMPDLCGQKVPTKEQVFAVVKTEWQSSVQRVAEEAQALKLPAPEVRLPASSEVTKAVCTVVVVPVLCRDR